MRKALATLPWVEQETIDLNTSTREVRFNLKDKEGFDEAKLRQALKDQRFPEMTIKTGPPANEKSDEPDA